jgi:hypothetical protein
VIFFASSRGSLVALLGGGLIGASVWAARSGKTALIAMAASLILSALMLDTFIRSKSEYVATADEVLQVSGDERGIGSGMSGRLSDWGKAENRLAHGAWFYGHGMRSTEELPFPVDNGYLTVLYDLGVVPLLVIIGRFIQVTLVFLKRYWVCRQARDLIFACFLIVFLVNNIVARYLFAIGNPFSLAALLFFVAPLSSPRAALANSPGLLNSSAPAAQAGFSRS